MNDYMPGDDDDDLYDFDDDDCECGDCDERACSECGECFYGTGRLCGGDVCLAFEEVDDEEETA